MTHKFVAKKKKKQKKNLLNCKRTTNQHPIQNNFQPGIWCQWPVSTILSKIYKTNRKYVISMHQFKHFSTLPPFHSARIISQKTKNFLEKKLYFPWWKCYLRKLKWQFFETEIFWEINSWNTLCLLKKSKHHSNLPPWNHEKKKLHQIYGVVKIAALLKSAS